MATVKTALPTKAAPAAAAQEALPFRTLIRTFGAVKTVMDPYFGQFGVSGAQWGTLRAIHRAKTEGLAELRLSDLGARLLIQPPSVTVIIQRLARMGLVKCTPSRQDKRAKTVHLTAKGETCVNRILAAHPAQMARVMAGLTDDEQQQLGALLGRLHNHLVLLAKQDAAPALPPSGTP